MKLILSQGPHIESDMTTPRIMLNVLVSLFPAVIASCILFSMRALLVIVVSVAAAVLSEHLFCLLTKKKSTVSDLSAAVTGLILALNLPYTMPIWQVVFGDIVAIAFVKMLFGGIGQNFANPAATARVILLTCFSETGVATATRFMTPAVDGVTSPTPLALLAKNDMEALPSITDMLLGNRGGALGETCCIAILIGFVYLLCRRIVSAEAPLAFIGTVFVFTLIVKGSAVFALYSVLSGGLFIGAFFMATDYATTPLSRIGKLVFGIGCGIITTVIRLFCNYPEGVSFSILLMNILVPFIDKFTRPHAFGGKKK